MALSIGNVRQIKRVRVEIKSRAIDIKEFRVALLYLYHQCHSPIGSSGTNDEPPGRLMYIDRHVVYGSRTICILIFILTLFVPHSPRVWHSDVFFRFPTGSQNDWMVSQSELVPLQTTAVGKGKSVSSSEPFIRVTIRSGRERQ